MRRRTFIAGLGSAAAWPVVAQAQQAERVRRIGILLAGDENDPAYKRFVSAFTQALSGLGWTDSRNVRMDLRWGGTDTNRMRALATELVGLQPDIILAGGALAIIAVQQETRTIPIVFTTAGDPVATGIVPRLDRPSHAELAPPRFKNFWHDWCATLRLMFKMSISSRNVRRLSCYRGHIIALG
jgi:putative ABC transport system substrate-binding protein